MDPVASADLEDSVAAEVAPMDRPNLPDDPDAMDLTAPEDQAVPVAPVHAPAQVAALKVDPATALTAQVRLRSVVKADRATKISARLPAPKIHPKLRFNPSINEHFRRRVM